MHPIRLNKSREFHSGFRCQEAAKKQCGYGQVGILGTEYETHIISLKNYRWLTGILASDLGESRGGVVCTHTISSDLAASDDPQPSKDHLFKSKDYQGLSV